MPTGMCLLVPGSSHEHAQHNAHPGPPQQQRTARLVLLVAFALLVSLSSTTTGTAGAFLLPAGTAALALRQALCRRSSSASSGLHWTAAAAAAAAASSSSFWQRSGGSSSSLVVAAQPQGQQQQQQGKNSVRSIFTDAAERRRKQGEEAAEAAAKEAKERADAEDRSEDEAASKLAASRSAMAAARGDINVLGGALELCGTDPITGFTREGCCTTGPQDIGSHTVCSVLTEAFLSFSRSRGNDLVTPRPEYRFPGLKPGDRWCLCASRWQEALESGMAPKVVLAATHRKALDACSLDDLIAHAVDPPTGTTDGAEEGGAKEEL